MPKQEKMKTGQKTNSGKLSPVQEYFLRLHEAGKKGPANWIIVGPKLATELNKINKEWKKKK